MERAAIYNRCSTEEEAQKNALAIQAEESRERAAELGWEVTAQYIEAESGTDARKRTQYQRLLEDMEKGLFDIIMIKSIDRLMRSARDWYLFLDRLTVNHQRLYIYIDNKFYQPEDNLISGIKAILAEDFSRELSKKIKNAHRRRQEKKSGLNITVPMFGWDKQGKDHYVLNKQESDWYRMAFSLVENGMGFYRLSNYMFELGVRGKKGERISQVQWRKMLTSPRAYGTVVLHTREYDFNEKRYRTLPRQDWIYVEEAIPGIVDKMYFERVQSLIHSRNRHRQMPDRDGGREEHTNIYMGRYAFSGKLFCKECGSICYRIKRKNRSGEAVYWKCKGAIEGGKKSCPNQRIPEENIWNFLEQQFLEQQFLGQQSSGQQSLEQQFLTLIRTVIVNQREGSREKEKKTLEDRICQLQRKKAVLLNKLLEGTVADADYKEKSEELSQKKYELTQQLYDMSQQEEKIEEAKPQERLEKIVQYLKTEHILQKAEARAHLSEEHKIIIDAQHRMELQEESFCKDL